MNKDSETKGCCEECKAKPAVKGIIGIPWCGKFGKCDCHTPPETKENCSRCATTHSESEGCIDQSWPTPPETPSWEEEFEKLMPKTSEETISYGQFCALRNLIRSIASSEYKRGVEDALKKIEELCKDSPCGCCCECCGNTDVARNYFANHKNQ